MRASAHDYLRSLLTRNEDVRRIQERVRQVHPPFPEFGDTPWLAYVLFLAGLPGPFDSVPQRMVGKLLQSGWRLVSRPAPGDLAVMGEPARELGVVIGIGGLDRGWILLSTCRDARPGRRQISEVVGWLRLGG